jgi:cytochrome c biogenesis protein
MPFLCSSALRILQPTDATEGSQPATLLREAEISVNHPLRFQGVTFYQADWGLAALTLQLGRSPLLQLPLEAFPQIGDQVWGLLLPTRPDGSRPVLLLVSSEQGPVDIYGINGDRLGQLSLGGAPVDVDGLPGGGLSLVATRQLWAIVEPGKLHLAGLSNRSLTGLAEELPALISEIRC